MDLVFFFSRLDLDFWCGVKAYGRRIKMIWNIGFRVLGLGIVR